MSLLNIILTIIFILFTHFISDFVMQTDEMAKGKSTSIFWLTFHTIAYLIVSLIISVFYVTVLNQLDIVNYDEITSLMIYYYIINSIFHFLTDFITSKIAKYYFDKNEIHNGFVVIGVDQFIHSTTLILTFYFIFKNNLLIQ